MLRYLPKVAVRNKHQGLLGAITVSDRRRSAEQAISQVTKPDFAYEKGSRLDAHRRDGSSETDVDTLPQETDSIRLRSAPSGLFSTLHWSSKIMVGTLSAAKAGHSGRFS
jgi:hypothetical protein